MSNVRESDPRIARYAALQTVTEIGLGSLIHGLRIPLGGHFLSLNQSVLLTFAVRPVAGGRAVTLARKRGAVIASGVSLIAAGLKFLSPAGARLMPALGISIQGFIFSSGIFIFGLNRFGVCLGAALASVWVFLHPLVFGYLIFGETLFSAVVKLWSEISTKLGSPIELGIWILWALVLLKVLLAMGLSFFAWSADLNAENRYLEKIKQFTRSCRHSPSTTHLTHSPLRGTFFDLTRPIFLIALILSVGFMFWAGKNGREISVYFGRTIGTAGILFYSIRAFPPKLANKIFSRFPSLAQTAAEVRGSKPPYHDTE